ncbi:sporulation protein YtfJ [Peribacillus simplex]|uniref:GerW family sporulation protein n=1 Tax=Peribacillus simplex TaxID=1478 RepID=UPI000F63E71C|nr:GerW family sporulation protein [Peribacillus simplex]RRN74264.1 sporulation protein YtfJ [Peribacillus simplex]
MSDHPIQGLMKEAMENLKEMVDVNTIIGDPVETPDGSVILTVSKVGFGFAAGGSEFVMDGNHQAHQGDSKQPFGGGSGGGVSITPIAFLIVGSHGVKMIHLDEGTHLLEKMMDLAPQVVDKIQSMLSKKESSNQRQGSSSSQTNAKRYQEPKQDLDF